MKFPRGTAVIALGILALCLFAAAEEALSLPPYDPPENTTYTLRLWGNRNMGPLVRAWAKAYVATHGDIQFEFHLLGHGTAMPALYLGKADMAFFGRDLNVTDNDGFAHVLKYAPRRIELATGSVETPGQSPALALFVHRDNPLTRLTLAQIDAIFSVRRFRGAPEAIHTWGDLGLTGEWAREPIHIYADDTQSVTGAFFQRAALGNSRMMNWEHFTEFADERHADGTVTEAAQFTLAALRRDRFGLAVSTLHYADENVRALALAEKEGGSFVAPTRATTISRTYPLTRAIFACANQRPGRALDPKVRDFLRFLLSPEGQAMIEKRSGYLPLAPDVVEAERRKLE